MSIARFRLAVTVVTLALAATTLRGYVFYDPVEKWPDGSIVLQEQLGGGSGTLIDGNTSWNGAFEGAMATWNNYLGRVKLTGVRDSTAAIGDGNSINNVLFSDTVFGKPFSDNTLVVTTNWYFKSTGNRAEADIIFNNKWRWNSYRGALRDDAEDFFRVALHQLGHVLGLDHPDDYDQTVAAVMNSGVGDIDTLQPDDIAGAMSLYPVDTTPPSSQGKQFRATTDATGVATFSLTGASQFPIQVVDPTTGSPIAGLQAFLFSDANGVAPVVLYDPLGRYLPGSYEVHLPMRIQPLADATQRPVQLTVPTPYPDPTESTATWRTAPRTGANTVPWGQLNDQSLRSFVQAIGGRIDERDGTLADIGDIAELKGITGGATGVATVKLLLEFAFPELALPLEVIEWLHHAHDLVELAKISEGINGFPIRKWYECQGYKVDQQFHILIITLPTVSGLTRWVYARPVAGSLPAGPGCSLTGSTGNITGNVVDTKNRPVGGALVKGFGPTSFATVSASNGTFSFQNISAGTYGLTAEAKKYKRGIKDAVQVVKDLTKSGVTIVLTPAGIADIVISALDPTTISLPNGAVRFTAVAVDGSVPAVRLSPQPAFIWQIEGGAASIDQSAGVARAARVGTSRVTAWADGVTSNALPVTVVDSNPNCSYTLSSTAVTIPAGGGTSAVNVTTAANCAWSAVSNSPSFITVTGIGGGTGSGQATFAVAANTSTAARTGSVTISGQTVTVNQGGATSTCTYTLSTRSVNVAAAATAASVTVTTTTGCAWTATSGSSFISISSGGTGTGTGTVAFAIAANTGAARTGSLTIAGQAVTVTQAATTPPPSGQFDGTYRAVVSRSCTAGSNSSEPCNWASVQGACNPSDFTVTVTNGVVRDSCAWLTTATLAANGGYGGFYTAPASTRMPVTGTFSASFQIVGSDTHRGNTYNVTIQVTRR